jgi:LPXTG-motif cell wall-anchored protein
MCVANGNYDRNGLEAGDYSVELLPTAAQGESAQGVIEIALNPGATVVQHLALRSPLPEANPSAEPVVPATATPVPIPAVLPQTGSAGGSELPLIVVGLALIVLALGLGRRPT